MKERKLCKRERSRLKIMYEAARLFEERGIENVTFQQIADRADVCRTTVFNHFATTRELMNAIYMMAIESIKAHCLECGKSGLPLLSYMFDIIIDATAKYPVLIMQLTGTALLHEEQQVAVFSEIIKDNLPENVENKKAMTTLIIGAFFGMLYEYHAERKQFNAEAMKSEFQHLMDVLVTPYL